MAVKTPGKRIAILTGASLARNPRPLKEAISLERAGYEVVVYGANPDPSLVDYNCRLARHYGFTFLPLEFAFWPRARMRVGGELHRLFGLNCHWALGPCVNELYDIARTTKADYYIAHLEQAMWAGTRLLAAGHRVGVDMEDWYSEDMPVQARSRRPVSLLRACEQRILNGAAHVSAPSKAMSEVLAREFGCTQPDVIYNAFPWSDRDSLDGMLKDRNTVGALSIHWFSQTLGLGRGLEDLIAALQYVSYATEIHLRGTPAPGFEDWLKRNIPEKWRSHVFVHQLVPNDELLSRIAEHDIGFAGEMTNCRSRDLTITNKILQFLLAGLPVVASNTAGQREVAAQAPAAVALYPSGDPAALAARLNELLGSAERRSCARLAALRSAHDTFCWERQEGKLLDIVARGMGMSGTRGHSHRDVAMTESSA